MFSFTGFQRKLFFYLAGPISNENVFCISPLAFMVQSCEVSFPLCPPSPELQAPRGKSGVAPTEQVTGAGGGVGEPMSPPVSRRRGERVGEKSNPGGWALMTLKG